MTQSPFDQLSKSYLEEFLKPIGTVERQIETGEIENFLGQEIIMAFSQSFLDWEAATEAKGIAIGQREQARSLVLRQLARRIGIFPAELRSQIELLPVTQLDELGEALLDFEQLADLTDWLRNSTSTIPKS